MPTGINYLDETIFEMSSRYSCEEKEAQWDQVILNG